MEEVEKEEEEEGEVEEEGKEDLKTFLSECAHAALSVHACVYVFVSSRFASLHATYPADQAT